MPTRVLVDLVGITQEAVPWAIPLVAASFVAALLAGFTLSRSRGPSAWLVSALIVSAAFIVGLTLTPNAGGEDSLVDPRSHQGPWGYLIEPEYWLHVDARSLNVALFIPLGFTLALLTHGRARAIALAAGLVLPWLIEGLQAVLPFARDSQLNDVADNSLGLTLGFATGLAVSALLALPHQPSDST